MQPIYLCPICEQIMQPVAACKLQCACGYRETCSDLFPADRIVERTDDAREQTAADYPASHSKTRDGDESL